MTAAFYKLIDICSLLKLQEHAPVFVACIGDGSGGFTAAAGGLFPDAQLLHNSLIDLTGVVEASDVVHGPIFLKDIINSNRLDTTLYTSGVSQNIAQADFWVGLSRVIEQQLYSRILIVSDADIRGQDHDESVYKSHRLALDHMAALTTKYPTAATS